MKNKNSLIKFTLLPIILLVIYSVGTSTTYATSVNQDKLIELTNQERINAGLTPLITDRALSAAAFDKANDMIFGQYFEHYSPSGVSPWDFMTNAGYDYLYAGENLAMDFQNSEDIVNAWMASPAHKANIVNPKYENISLAVAQGNFQGHQTKMVVQMFGKSQKTSAPKIDNLIAKVRHWMLGL